MGARPSFSTFLTSTPAASRCLPLSPARSSTFCGRIHDFPDYLDPRAIFPEIFSEVYNLPTANPYRGCGHGCAHCYVPLITKQDRREFDAGASREASQGRGKPHMARLVRTGQQFGSLLRPPASPIAGLKACPSKLFLLLLTQLGAYRTATNLSWAIWHKCTSALYALFQLDFFDDDTATFWACPPLKRVAFVGHLLWLPPFIERSSSAMQEHRDIFEMICCVFRDCVRFRTQVGK